MKLRRLAVRPEMLRRSTTSFSTHVDYAPDHSWSFARIRGGGRVFVRVVRRGVSPMFGLGSQELLVILVIALVLFGANRLPQLARSLGSSLKEFKKGIDDAQVKETSVSPPSADSGASTAGERSCAQCKSALAPDWTHCPRCGT